MKEEAIDILQQAGIRETPNRVLVTDALLSARSPISLVELETQLQTLERSSVLRVLTLLLDHDIVHSMQDGRGITKYEVCHTHGHDSLDDRHVHFYCERCEKTFCFTDTRIPEINMATGFEIRSANFMLKGLCPNCRQ